MNKKRIITLIVTLVTLFILILPASAELRINRIQPLLSYSGTTANCGCVVSGDYATDSISVTMKLWDGSSSIATWYGSGNGYVSLSKTKTVVKGKTYKLSVDATINGTKYTTVYLTKKCQ